MKNTINLLLDGYQLRTRRISHRSVPRIAGDRTPTMAVVAGEGKQYILWWD